MNKNLSSDHQHDPIKIIEKLKTQDDAASGADFSGVIFKGHDVSTLSFRKAKLVGADFSGCNMTGCRLSRTDLTQANLSKTTLDNCYVYNADLRQANLADAHLAGGEWSYIDCTDVIADGFSMKNMAAMGTNFTGAQLKKAQLINVNLSFSKFVNASLYEANLSKSELHDADFSNCDLQKANLMQAELKGAILATANLNDAIFTGATYDEHTSWPGEPPADAIYIGKKKKPDSSVKKVKLTKNESLNHWKLLGYVDSFGEPLLILDSELVKNWKGFESNNIDPIFTKAWNEFDQRNDAPGVECKIGSQSVFLWDIEGEGTGYVLQNGTDSFMLIRPWLSESEDEISEEELAIKIAQEPIKKSKTLSTLTIDSGVLTIMSSAADGTKMNLKMNKKKVKMIEGTMQDALLTILEPGRYEIIADSVDISAGSARRCYIHKV